MRKGGHECKSSATVVHKTDNLYVQSLGQKTHLSNDTCSRGPLLVSVN